MPCSPVQDVAQPWASSGPGLTSAVVSGPAPDVPAVRLRAAAAAGTTFTLDLPIPADLGNRDELRCWVRSDRAADGSATRPWTAEIGYDDDGDTGAQEHSWLVPVERSERWQQLRVGLEQDRRTAVTRLRLRVLTDLPVRVDLAELVACADAPARDVEAALASRLARGVGGLGRRTVVVDAASAGTTTVVVEHTPAIRTGARVQVAGEDPPIVVVAVAHDPAGGRSTLTLSPRTALPRDVAAGAPVSVLVPVLPHEPAPGGTDVPPADPAVLLDLVEHRDEPGRSWAVPQRDSFRRRGEAVLCSVQPPPTPLLLEHQVQVSAGDRAEALHLRDRVMASLDPATPLRVGGVALPLVLVAPPPRSDRDQRATGPVVVQVRTVQRAGPRVETPAVRSWRVVAAQPGHADDAEVVHLDAATGPT